MLAKETNNFSHKRFSIRSMFSILMSNPVSFIHLSFVNYSMNSNFQNIISSVSRAVPWEMLQMNILFQSIYIYQFAENVICLAFNTFLLIKKHKENA